METAEYQLGVTRAGQREAHIVGESLETGAALSLCGKQLRIWPLAEGEKIRVCNTCQSYAMAARMTAI